MASITSANAVLTLAIVGLFNTPQQLQGFAADNIFTTDPIDPSETLMGIDGILSGGFVFVPIKWNISLQADSASNAIFDAWWRQQKQNKDVFIANGTLQLISIQTKWRMTTGFLTTYPTAPDGARVLQPRRYAITWQDVAPAATS